MPRGRPPGVRNRPNPIKADVKAAFPGKIQKRRPPGEALQGQKNTTLPMDAVSHLCLSIHAQRRHIPLTWLIQDILNCWLASATDYSQGAFQDFLAPNTRAAKCPERFVGYIAGLGFAPAEKSLAELGAEVIASEPKSYTTGEPVHYPPQPPSPSWGSPLPPQKTLTDLTQPYRHPLTMGPASYPHPAPQLPPSSQLFDPQAHAAVSGAKGFGNAAQQATDGTAEDDSSPRLPEAVEKYADFYRVDIKDVR